MRGGNNAMDLGTLDNGKRTKKATRNVAFDHPPGDPTQTPPAPANFRDWKHSRQKTGRPCVGRNGTVVSFPHAEQLVVVSTRSRPIVDPPPPEAGRDARLALQLLQRLGSFLKFLSAKKSCSPAVQMNSVPQSTQFNDLSWNSIGPTYLSPTRPPAARAGRREAVARVQHRLPAPRMHAGTG